MGCGVGKMGYYRQGNSYHVYKIKSGDTLSGVSERYGVSAEKVAMINNIKNPNKLRAGQKIKIPANSRAGSAADVSSGRKAGKGSGKSSRRKTYGKIAYTRSAPEPEIVKGKVKKYGLQWPLKGVLYSKFGMRNGRHHDGIDISAPRGTVIRAAGDGKVLFSNVHRGYGNLIIIGHTKTLVTVYAHNEKNLVKVGDKVKRGEKIALVGQTGRATGPHLHFEVRIGTKPQNPLKYLP